MDKLSATVEQQLQQKEFQLQSLNHKLLVSDEQCASLQSTLISREEQLAAIKSQVSMKDQQLGVLNQALDDKQFELETIQNKGKDLLTFQGESPYPTELHCTSGEMTCRAKLMAGLPTTSFLL